MYLVQTISITAYMRLAWCYYFMSHSENTPAHESRPSRERQANCFCCSPFTTDSGPDYMKGDLISTKPYIPYIYIYISSLARLFRKNSASIDYDGRLPRRSFEPFPRRGWSHRLPPSHLKMICFFVLYPWVHTVLYRGWVRLEACCDMTAVHW